MKIHQLSDLHLEFAPHRLQVVDADVIALAGDIGIGLEGIRWAASLLQETKADIIYICGNHEFYGHEIHQLHAEIKAFVASNSEGRLHFLDDEQVVIDGVRFLGSTLWTDLKLFGDDLKDECMLEGNQSLNDFRLIDIGEWTLTTLDSLHLHRKSVAWLESKLKKEKFDGKTVVITHHLPSKDSVATRYRKELLSACFASNLDYLFGYSTLWMHGHTHDSFDYVSKGTRVVCNPRGYHQYGSNENENFNPKLVIEI